MNKKILYVWEHDVSLGDSLTNFHAHLCVVKNKYPLSIIHAIVNPRTYNTGVTNLLINKGLIDFVYPFHINKIDNDINVSYKNLLLNINFDIVIHNKHSSVESTNLIKKIFDKQIHLQTSESNFKFEDLFEYFNISYGDEYLRILKECYHTNYVDLFVKSYLDKSNNKKTMALFSGSTRPLANLGKDGINIITKLAEELKIHVFLVGTSMHNLYNNNGVNWEEIYKLDYLNSTNLIGNNWIKTTSLLNKLDIVVSGPTGASMITPLINKSQIVIMGGDSPIMEGCLNGYTLSKYTSIVKCECENYPCGLHNKINSNVTKYNTCISNSNPICLNEELNLESIKNLLLKI